MSPSLSIRLPFCHRQIPTYHLISPVFFPLVAVHLGLLHLTSGVDSLIPRPPSLRTTTRLALGRQQPASRVLGAASVHVVTIVDFIKANDFARRHRRKSDVAIARSLARSLWRRVRSARFRRVREIHSRIRTPLPRIRREPRDRRSLPILRQA